MPKLAHTCGGPKFGKLTAGCPRCDELARERAEADAARRAPAERGRAAALQQLPTCCHSHITAWHMSRGCYTLAKVRGCPRHGDVDVALAPGTPIEIYEPPAQVPVVLAEQLF